MTSTTMSFTAVKVAPRHASLKPGVPASPTHRFRGMPVLRKVSASAQAAETASVTETKTPFFGVNSEEKFFGTMDAMVKAGKFPEKLVPLWTDFYQNYKGAVLSSGLKDESFVAEVQSAIADRVLHQFMEPYKFPSYHTRILEPYDYYDFGQKYVGALINFDESWVGNADNVKRISELLAEGHNVIVMANHQTEADPAVWAYMTQDISPAVAENVIYVAGDRVVDDAMCKPFSMGRNLLCVHSKKHMFDDPDTVQDKQRQNRKTLVTMTKMLHEGGHLIWIAPAGGRDRPKEVDGKDVWAPDAFDPSAVGLMAKLAATSKSPTHLFPMAMVSWAVMPPPPKLEKALGERRITNYTGVGISICDEVDVSMLQSLAEEGEDPEVPMGKYMHDMVSAEYKMLEAMVYARDTVSEEDAKRFSQPWKQ